MGGGGGFEGEGGVNLQGQELFSQHDDDDAATAAAPATRGPTATIPMS